MKVGVDGVLLGAWAGVKEGKILDVGTGCGLIALMLAQRFPGSEIIGIDIDEASVMEAGENFAGSPWGSKMRVILGQFPDAISEDEKFDLIVSNPPYFRSGVDNPETSRERARHQDSLSIFTLMKDSRKFLRKEGRLAMIFPGEFYEELIKEADNSGFSAARVCFIRNNERRPYKRVMTELIIDRKGDRVKAEMLTLFRGGEATEEYKKLCGEFYLNL